MIRSSSEPSASEELICSSRGCRQVAGYAVRWNNPKLHTPDRRKVWLACAAHRDVLADFLSLRGFLRDVVPVAQLRADLPAESAGEVRR